jgi:hypothetical protein
MAMWIGFIRFRTGTRGGFSWHRNEPSGSIKGGKFLDCFMQLAKQL